MVFALSTIATEFVLNEPFTLTFVPEHATDEVDVILPIPTSQAAIDTEDGVILHNIQIFGAIILKKIFGLILN